MLNRSGMKVVHGIKAHQADCQEKHAFQREKLGMERLVIFGHGMDHHGDRRWQNRQHQADHAEARPARIS